MTHKNKKAALKAAFLFLYSVVFRFVFKRRFKINAGAREGTGSAVFFQYFHNVKAAKKPLVSLALV